MQFRVVLFVIALSASVAGQSFPFVIPGDDSTQSVVSRATLLPPIQRNQFVQVRDSHFYVGERRLRFWGVNLCFGANFPTHDEADKLAPHMAKLGINAVRFHHMDMQDAPNGLWAPVKDGVRNFDPEMIDRLDYFLAKLHDNNIYADLNLHVSRTLTTDEGFPAASEGMPWWAASNKWVMYYDRDVQAQVKRFCRELLTHKNPYRNNVARVDDSGIALVEMLNENYFSTKGYDLYRRMPKRFQQSLIGRWNEWLAQQYPDHQAMISNWKKAQPPMGDVLIPKSDWSKKENGWAIIKPEIGLGVSFGAENPPSKSGSRSGNSAIRFEPVAVTEQDHQQQLMFRDLSVEEGQPLSIAFWVRADKERSYRAEISSSAGGEWRDLGLFETLQATTDWQLVERVAIPGETVPRDVNFAFTFGGDKTPIEFAAASLQQGAKMNPLPEGQTLAAGNIGIPAAGWPVQAHRDMKTFMVDTEVQWTSELKVYLRELGVKVPITASQINYHDQRVHDEVNDFVDLHNYWHHPMFPSGANWSPDRWTVQNEPMEAHPSRSKWPANSLLMRTGWRIEGKPMTLSEWNYPEPSPYSAGCVPMAATLAALQDWDGIFFFDYDAFSRKGDSSQFFRDQTNNFFSFNGQPVKLATFSQCANIFLRGDLAALQSSQVSSPDAPIDGRLALTSKLGVKTNAEPTVATVPEGNTLATPNGNLSWTFNDKDKGTLTLNTPATKGVWGTIGDAKYSCGDIDLAVGSIQPNYGMVLLSSIDGQPIESCQSMVLLTAGHSENQNMGWNADRTSVGTEWGDGPTQVTAFNVTLRLPDGDWNCWPLSGTGQRLTAQPVTASDGQVTVTSEMKTLWYELSRK